MILFLNFVKTDKINTLEYVRQIKKVNMEKSARVKLFQCHFAKQVNICVSAANLDPFRKSLVSTKPSVFVWML